MLRVRFKQVYTTKCKYYDINYEEITLKNLYENLQPLIERDFGFSKFHLISPFMNPIEDSSIRIKEEGPPLNFLSQSYLRDKISKKDCQFMYIYPLNNETVNRTLNLTCVICMENDRNILIEPCHHICCCRTCIDHLRDGNRPNFNCPICRTSITRTVEIYFS
jgi:hypothetical protein